MAPAIIHVPGDANDDTMVDLGDRVGVLDFRFTRAPHRTLPTPVWLRRVRRLPGRREWLPVELSKRQVPTATAIDDDWDWNEAVAHLRSVDPRFAPVIAARPDPLVVTRARSPLDALLRAVIYQQLSTKAAATIHGRFLDLFPRRRPSAAAIDQTGDAAFRGAGLSAGKLRAVRDLARFSREGALPGYAALGRLADDEVIARLTEVHGVGVWTAEMLLIFQLGRPDVLPVGDLGVRKGFARIRGRGGDVTPAQLERAAKKWRPYRSVASWYCYRALEI